MLSISSVCVERCDKRVKTAILRFVFCKLTNVSLTRLNVRTVTASESQLEICCGLLKNNKTNNNLA